ncbi:MAG: hypothetical protein AAGA93_23385 [Actinomycetota bacterium]
MDATMTDQRNATDATWLDTRGRTIHQDRSPSSYVGQRPAR